MECRLAYLTRVEATERAQAGAVCLVPVGSLEQHGDHLPLATDSLLAEHVCLRAAAEARADVLVAPLLWTGFSPHHLRFGATVTLASSTFSSLLRDTVSSLRTWCTRVIVVNGHGGNRGPLITLGIEDGVEAVSYWELVPPELLSELFPFDLGSVGHAGELETSLALAAMPAHVREPGLDFEAIAEVNAAFLVPELGTSGVLGDPHAASAEAGRELLGAVAAAFVRLIDGEDEHLGWNEAAELTTDEDVDNLEETT